MTSVHKWILISTKYSTDALLASLIAVLLVLTWDVSPQFSNRWCIQVLITVSWQEEVQTLIQVGHVTEENLAKAVWVASQPFTKLSIFKAIDVKNVILTCAWCVCISTRNQSRTIQLLTNHWVLNAKKITAWRVYPEFQKLMLAG